MEGGRLDRVLLCFRTAPVSVKCIEKVLSVLVLEAEDDEELRYGESMADIRICSDEVNSSGNRKMAYFLWPAWT